jgi:hypothetical protein
MQDEKAGDRGWVSLRQFAQDIAHITYPTALRWRKQNRIITVPHGGIFRVYADEIRRYLEHGTLPPDPIALAEEKRKQDEYRANGERRRQQQQTQTR